MVNLQKIVSELKQQRDRLNQAIVALEGIDAVNATTPKSATPTLVIRKGKKRGHLSPEGRKKISEMMKKRWAERRRKGLFGRKAA
jgi:hypothetical protein